jgi:GNAT superfamily N-acetyltransferase
VPAPATAGFGVRPATRADLPAIAVAVCALVIELGGRPAPQRQLLGAARTMLEQPREGTLFVADAAGKLVGVLGVSWQSAVRVPGRYGLIQELWVDEQWRNRGVGGALLAALATLAQKLGIACIEVGLPGERFSQLAATEAFYAAHGFSAVGTRMRRSL